MKSQLGTDQKVQDWAEAHRGWVNTKSCYWTSSGKAIETAYLINVDVLEAGLVQGFGRTPQEARGALWDLLVRLGIAQE